MSVYLGLLALLNPIAASYADYVPQGIKTPYLRYQQIGGRNSNTTCHTTSARRGGVPLIQIDVHAKNASERDTLLQAIDAAIETNRSQGLKPRLQAFEHPTLSYDESTKTYMAVLTYQVTSF